MSMAKGMVFHSKRSYRIINGEAIKLVYHIKFLGTTISTDQSWDSCLSRRSSNDSLCRPREVYARRIRFYSTSHTQPMVYFPAFPLGPNTTSRLSNRGEEG